MGDDPIAVFEISRGWDVSFGVTLRPSWAIALNEVRLVFRNSGGFGWSVTIESPDGGRVLGFPWSDHVDRMLTGESPSELPDPALPDGHWDDLEQGWWGSIRVAGDDVFIAGADFDALCAVPGRPEPEPERPGLVQVAGVPILWSRVPRTAWDEAWSAARASCVAGAPSPTGTDPAPGL